MQLTPVIAIHLSAALGAIALGPLALWARRGHAGRVAQTQRPRLHRAAGYAWVTLMLATAVSAIFIRDHSLPNIAGNIAGHRKAMVQLYVGACLVAGGFTLLPSRFLGQLVWDQWLGLV